MKCKLEKCNNNHITLDGYCDKHGYYSNCNIDYIVKHIKNYLDQMTEANGLKKKVKLSINLYYYLTFKKNFLIKSESFYYVLIKKGKQLLAEMQSYNFFKEYNEFHDLLNKIESFK